MILRRYCLCLSRFSYADVTNVHDMRADAIRLLPLLCHCFVVFMLLRLCCALMLFHAFDAYVVTPLSLLLFRFTLLIRRFRRHIMSLDAAALICFDYFIFMLMAGAFAAATRRYALRCYAMLLLFFFCHVDVDVFAAIISPLLIIIMRLIARARYAMIFR